MMFNVMHPKAANAQSNNFWRSLTACWQFKARALPGLARGVRTTLFLGYRISNSADYSEYLHPDLVGILPDVALGAE